MRLTPRNKEISATEKKSLGFSFFFHRVTVLSTQSKPSKGSTCSCTELRPVDSAWILGCPLLHYMGETPTAVMSLSFPAYHESPATQNSVQMPYLWVLQRSDECFIQTERERERERKRKKERRMKVVWRKRSKSGNFDPGSKEGEDGRFALSWLIYWKTW